MSKRTGWSPNPTGRVRVPQDLPVLRRLGRSSDGAWLKTTRARRETASLHHFSQQEAESPPPVSYAGSFPCNSESCSHFSERSLEVRHSAWDRDHACASHAAPTSFFQVCGSVSGAPAREAGEAGANPAHLTTARGDEGVESALCRREVSRCKSDHERQFSRCRLAARAAGLHPAITGVRVPPPRPLPGSSTVERPPVKRRDVGANPTPAASFVGETASEVTCPTCRHCSEHHRGRRPLCARSVRGACAQPAEAPRSKAPRQKGQQHDRCPHGRLVRGCRSRAHRTG